MDELLIKNLFQKTLDLVAQAEKAQKAIENINKICTEYLESEQQFRKLNQD